jgi:hypothetical protein
MYGILLKWGLDSAFTFLRDKDPKNIQILLEAIKTRNALVVKRFEYAWEASQALANFTMDCEEALRSFREAQPDELNVKDYINKLQHDFHPVQLRRFKKIRGQFEAINDLFSAYTIMCLRMLQWSNVDSILQSQARLGVSDVNRSYRFFGKHRPIYR